MTRFDGSHSLGALVSISRPKVTDEEEEEEQLNSESKRRYSKEFQAMLDSIEQEDSGEELMGPGKKRRLRSEQVKALERHFEVENKLEPERKVKLADELGLQPRQVAIWFQNRRARWKTKQLERDFGLLKSNYNSLKLSFQDLQHQNQALTNKVRQLREKVCRGESSEEESPASENNNEIARTVLDYRKKESISDIDEDDEQQQMIEPRLIGDEDRSLQFSLGLNGSSSSSSSSSNNNNNNSSLMPSNWPFRLSESSRTTCQPRLEEVQFMANHMSPFGSDEPNCNNFFSVDQAPTLYWYFPEQ